MMANDNGRQSVGPRGKTGCDLAQTQVK